MPSTPLKKGKVHGGRGSTGAAGAAVAESFIEGSPPTAQTAALRPEAMVAAIGSLALLSGDLPKLLDEVTQKLAETLHVDLVQLLQLEGDGQSMLLRAGVGWKPGLVGSARASAGPDSPAGLTLLANEPVVSADLTTEKRFALPRMLSEHGVVSGMTVAIEGQPRPFGVLGVFSKQRREYVDDEVNLLRAIANILAAAIKDNRSQQALRDGEARVRAIVNTLVDGIITIDERGIIDWMNPAAERLFGYKSPEVLGRNVNVLMPEPYRGEHDVYLLNYLRTGRAKIIGIGREVVGRRKDGTVFPMDLAVSELNVGGRRMFTGVVRDITERRRLEREILDAGTEEQRRIGRDLHDGLCQQLTGIAFATEVLTQKLTARSAPEAASLKKVAELVDQSITQARDLARGLQPVTLEAGGLAAALEALAKQLEGMFHVSCVFVCDGPCLVHDNTVATHLYRIAQEATSNAVKHGKARTVVIDLAVAGDELRLVISDDGVGLANAATDGKGIGLQTMDYRARIVGGELKVRPGERGGTTVTCIVRGSNIGGSSSGRATDGQEGFKETAAGRKSKNPNSRRRRPPNRPRASG
jgi:two-component system, LuxR family, sensor kinase FixL